MFRFTIRDVLWAMLAVGICFGWFVHIQVKNRQRDAWYDQILKQQSTELEWYRKSWETAQKGSSQEN
jgi:hypothetical protein